MMIQNVKYFFVLNIYLQSSWSAEVCYKKQKL